MDKLTSAVTLSTPRTPKLADLSHSVAFSYTCLILGSMRLEWVFALVFLHQVTGFSLREVILPNLSSLAKWGRHGHKAPQYAESYEVGYTCQQNA